MFERLLAQGVIAVTFLTDGDGRIVVVKITLIGMRLVVIALLSHVTHQLRAVLKGTAPVAVAVLIKGGHAGIATPLRHTGVIVVPDRFEGRRRVGRIPVVPASRIAVTFLIRGNRGTAALVLPIGMMIVIADLIAFDRIPTATQLIDP